MFSQTHLEHPKKTHLLHYGRRQPPLTGFLFGILPPAGQRVQGAAWNLFRPFPHTSLSPPQLRIAQIRRHDCLVSGRARLNSGPSARVQECRPRLLHFSRRRGADRGMPPRGSEAGRRTVDHPPVSACARQAGSPQSHRSKVVCAPPATSSCWRATCVLPYRGRQSSVSQGRPRGVLPGCAPPNSAVDVVGRPREVSLIMI